MKPGYTLIELVIVVLFLSIIVSTVLGGYFFITRVMVVVDRAVSVDMRLALLRSQLEREVSGIFIPLQAIQGPIQKVQVDDQKITASAAATKEQAKPIVSDVVYSKNKGDMLAELSFVTSNPIAAYSGADNAGGVQARIVRVTYRVVQQDKEQRYSLLRSETTTLSREEIKKLLQQKKIREYEFIGNIKHISLEFMVPNVQTQDKQAEKDKPIVSKEWPMEQKKDEQKLLLAQRINVRVVLWDDRQQQEVAATIPLLVPTFQLPALPQKQVPKQQQNASAPKVPPQPGAPKQTAFSLGRRQPRRVVGNYNRQPFDYRQLREQLQQLG